MPRARGRHLGRLPPQHCPQLRQICRSSYCKGYVTLKSPQNDDYSTLGIYSAGGAVGATIAPVLVVLIAENFGWRWVFAVTPVVACLWLAFWLWVCRDPASHPHITEKEKTLLSANLKLATNPTEPRESELILWGRVLREPLVWILMFARLITDPVWYFFQFWFPKYLHDERGLEQKGLAIMWLIFGAATIGFIAGGFFSGWLVKRGVKPSASRIWIMMVSACVAPLIGVIPFLPTTMVVISVVCFSEALLPKFACEVLAKWGRGFVPRWHNRYWEFRQQ
jgi:MFS transporter, ACS family, hexuronate transporter